MSSGTPLGLSAMPFVLNLLARTPDGILGGSLGMALHDYQDGKYRGDVVHDLDVIFTNKASCTYFLTQCGLDNVKAREVTPYQHWTAKFKGIPLCIYVNKTAHTTLSWCGLAIQDKAEIEQLKAELYANKKRSSLLE